MESIKLKNEKYWDATGVYDHTKQKTQDELNEEFDKTIQNMIVISNTEPTDPNVKLWMYQNPGQKIEIPTMEDFRNLKHATDEQVSAAVSDWLEENISGGETIAVDKSLTVEGAAADAKVVGDLKSAVDEVSQATTSTTLGPSPIVTFDAFAADMPLKGLTVNIEPVQSGSGDPSPTNVRPISGWMGCNVTRAGKNQFSITATTSTVNGVDYTINADGTITVSGTASGGNSAFNIGSVFLKKGTRYRITGCPATGSPATYELMLIESPATGSRSIARDTGAGTTYTETNIAVRGLQIVVRNGQTVNNLLFAPMIRFFDTPDTFVKGTVINRNIAFPTEAGTDYGGTLDVVNKRLTVDSVSVTIDGSRSNGLTWGKDGDLASIKFDTAASPYLPMVTDTPLLSNYLIKVAPFSGVPWSIETGSGTFEAERRMWFKIPLNVFSSQNLNGALAYFAEHPLQVCYKLASPIVYDLTDIPEITTLLGTNNIWADCGDVTVTYGAYLETLKASLDHTNGELDTLRACIAPIEDGATASQAYAAGAYFFRNGSFCTALTTISSGAAFTLGTNYQVTTVAAALIALQS